MIQVQNLSKSFKKIKVLEDISFEISKGECVVINGVSGSGKSTLLSIVGSLMKPSSGNVVIDNMEINVLNDFRLSDFRANTVGFVTQSFHLFEMLNVRENIVLALLAGESNQEEITTQVDSVMDLTKIEHKQDSTVSTLSGGEKQRCIIARALVNNPKVLLFDEPTASLDRENSLQFIEILKELKKQGKTILIATHDPFMSEQKFVDRIINIEDGKIE